MDETSEKLRAVNAGEPEPFKVAVIGGGPGGMFATWHLAAKAGHSCQITVFEASDRLGGKIQTGQFAGVGPYEAGVAEYMTIPAWAPTPCMTSSSRTWACSPSIFTEVPASSMAKSSSTWTI